MVDESRLKLELTPTRNSVRVARRRVTSWIESVGIDGDVDTDLVALLVSELATNATVHVGRPFTISTTWHSPTLKVEVVDADPTVPSIRRAHGDTRPGGRGLLLVDRCADRWGVTVDEDRRKTVWFTLEAPARSCA
jgi:anti-sigma regulatory factor (Ser/Thr protein kinase)